MKYKEVESFINTLKSYISREYAKKDFEHVLSLISVIANILYTSNLYYADYDLENYIASVAENLNLTEGLNEKFSDDVVLFYDAFGLNFRGLIQIYLKALCKIKKVVYVTYADRKNQIPDVLKILGEHDCKSFFLDRNFNIQMIHQLNEIVRREKPGHFFFYALPNDVIATVIMNAYEGRLKRYQVNLTDHAFWLGAKPIDVCIDFRDYGAGISYHYRKIPKSKIVQIPYYPIINYNAEFQGIPSDIKDGQKIIFSGGSIYKTLGGGNKYYEIVNHILENYPEAIFWYAGDRSCKEMDKILRKYPGRAFLTPERTDLYQVLQHCYFYLSTYPVCGGLMFQYAAKAGKIPVTLYYDDMTHGILINQAELGVMFKDLDSLYEEIDKLMKDKDYCETKGKSMIDAVISENGFDGEIAKLFTDEAGKTYPVNYPDSMDTSHFRQVYLDNLKRRNLKAIIANKKVLFLMRYEPLSFIEGVLYKVAGKLLRFMKTITGKTK